MFKWFKKKAVKPVPNPSSIAPLYIASTNQIQGTIDAVNELSPKIDDLQNRLDNLPAIPDLTQYARKDQTNTFTDIQEIKTTAPYLAFKKNDNSRKGYIGTPSSSSNDIELKAETNSLMLNANHNINLTAGANYNVLVNKAPNTDLAVANKGYVDTQIAAIPKPDLNNLARTDRGNAFSGDNSFTSIKSRKILLTQPMTTDPNCVATREYVDANANGNVIGVFEEINKALWVLTKKDISSNLWYYMFDSNSFSIQINGAFKNKKLLVIPYTKGVYVSGGSYKDIRVIFPPSYITSTSSNTITYYLGNGTCTTHHWDWKSGEWNGSQNLIFNLEVVVMVVS